MKVQKFLTGAFFLLAIGSLTSCSNDNNLEDLTDVASQQVGVVTFKAALPSNLVSRALAGDDTMTPLSRSVYSDGTSATTLYYAVYSVDADGNTALVVTNYGSDGDNGYKKDDISFVNLSANVTLQLVIGKQYKALFWAQSPLATQYSFDTAAGTITIDNSKLLCNDESQDAFYSCTSFTFGHDTAEQSVVLTRPFAQLNIGATDYAYAEELGFDMQESQLSIPYLNNVLNLFDGTVSGLVASTDYQYNVIPAKQDDAGDFPAKENGKSVDAKYVAMAYILVGDQGATCEIQYNYKNVIGLTLNSTNVHKFHSVPLSRNHRTNIYGSVLTATQTWTVNINSAYLDDDINEDMANVNSESAFWAE